VIAAYALVTGAIGLWASRRQTTTRAYFIADKRVPAFAVGFALMATTISSATFVAIPGAVFARNWWQMLYMMMAAVAMIFVVAFVVPFYRHVVKMSAYEYLERRLGYGSRLYGSAGFVILRIVDLGFTLYLTAVAVNVITGWNIQWVVLGVGLFTIGYTLIGGIEAAIWTSVLQGGIFLGGAVIILGTILSVPEAPPWRVVGLAYEGGKFDLGSFDPSWRRLWDPNGSAWIYMAAGLLHFGRYYVTEQSAIQRYLVARTDREAQKGVALGIMTTVPTWFTFAFIGSCLWSFYQLVPAELPQRILDQPDNILPWFLATQLPRGLVGLLLAGLLSSAMSSVSADLNSIATVATQDYYARALPQSSDGAQLLFARFAVLGGGILASGAALLLTFTRSTAAYELVVVALSIVGGGMLGLFALGFFDRRVTVLGANAGILACLAFTGWATLTGPMGVDLGINFTMNSVLIGVFSHFVLFGVGWAVSRSLGGRLPEVAGLTYYEWRPPSAPDGTPPAPGP
jgi:SSS family solute:Na+ symporter